VFQEIEGVGGGAGEGVLVQDFFGQGADEGFTVELAVVVLFGALDDVVDVERLLGRKEYVVYNIHIRLTLRLWRRGFAVFRSAEGTQGAELGQCGIFQDINEVIFIQWVHNAKKRLVTGQNMEYE
jgi:hypothetical protein